MCLESHKRDTLKILPAALAYIILQLHRQIGGRNSNELICVIQALKPSLFETRHHQFTEELQTPKYLSPIKVINKLNLKQIK